MVLPSVTSVLLYMYFCIFFFLFFKKSVDETEYIYLNSSDMTYLKGNLLTFIKVKMSIILAFDIIAVALSGSESGSWAEVLFRIHVMHL